MGKQFSKVQLELRSRLYFLFKNKEIAKDWCHLLINFTAYTH